MVMTIHYAVDRLYESGWLPLAGMELERLPNNGLRYPSVATVIREFNNCGLELSIKPHLMFGCCRAEWSALADRPTTDELNGTVVGACDSEAAVYALAKLREQLVDRRVAAGDSESRMANV